MYHYYDKSFLIKKMNIDWITKKKPLRALINRTSLSNTPFTEAASMRLKWRLVGRRSGERGAREWKVWEFREENLEIQNDPAHQENLLHSTTIVNHKLQITHEIHTIVEPAF